MGFVGIHKRQEITGAIGLATMTFDLMSNDTRDVSDG